MDICFLGFDIGTSSAKGIIFNEKGNIITQNSYSYSVVTPRPGWKEQDAGLWWKAIQKLSTQLLSDIKKDSLQGIGITHQRMTIVPVNDTFEPLDRAILWNDSRCTKEVEWVENKIGAHKVFRETGCPPGLWSIYKILWVKRNKPELYEKTERFLLIPDFLTWKLTGNIQTTQSAAVLTGALDIEDPTQWNSPFLEKIGISESLLTSPIKPGCTVGGTVTRAAADQTGIPEGLPVINTAGDQPCGSLGAGIVKPGIAGINGGTSATVEAISEAIPSRNSLDYFLEISPHQQYIMETSIYSGGAELMKWYKHNFGLPEVKEATEGDKDVWSVIYDKAKEATYGNRGMMLVPFFGGAGPPFWELKARGILFGIDTKHGRANLVRAIMEGLAYEVRRSIENLNDGGSEKIDHSVMYGGSSKSPVWNNIFANILGHKISTIETAEATSLGASICAAVGVGFYKTPARAVKNMVHTDESYYPDPDRKKTYDQLYHEVYSKFYDKVIGLMKKAREIGESKDNKSCT